MPGVVPIGAAAGKVDPVFVTAEGICLRHGAWDLSSGLPECRLLEGPMPGRLPVYILGEEHPDPRVLAAAAVAVEWRDAVAPGLTRPLPLVEVDASNLHYRLLADRRTSQVRVVVRRGDGGEARLDYGQPPNQPLPRVALIEAAERSNARRGGSGTRARRRSPP